jgi:hypothetical protein
MIRKHAALCLLFAESQPGQALRSSIVRLTDVAVVSGISGHHLRSATDGEDSASPAAYIQKPMHPSIPRECEGIITALLSEKLRDAVKGRQTLEAFQF